MAVAALSDFRVRDEMAAGSFRELYGATRDAALAGAGRDTFEAVKLLESVQRQPYRPAAGADYPNGRLGQSLRQIAQLLKADVGLEVAFADMGGWDTHVNEVGIQPAVGPLANLLREFGNALAAFYRDMGDRMADITVVTMSEFGRTARENGSRGTDHGHANFMFAMGGGVHGGRIYGDWPGLAPEQLHEGRDLRLSTDFRGVLSEIIEAGSTGASSRVVFPGYTPARRLGLIRRA